MIRYFLSYTKYLMVIILLSSCQNNSTNTIEEVQNYPEVMADKLYFDFKKNSVNAESIYKDKYYTIVGQLAEINRDRHGNTYIALIADYNKIGIACYFNKTEQDNNISTLEKGKKVKVSGKINGFRFGYVEVSDCKMVAKESSTEQISTTVNEVNAPGTTRKMILNALRIPVEKELNQKVKFVVRKLEECNNYALVLAKPIQENGKEVNYKHTEYQEYINEGVFDEGIQAILYFDGANWVVKDYQIGATDSPIEDWVNKYNLKSCKKTFGLN